MRSRPIQLLSILVSLAFLANQAHASDIPERDSLPVLRMGPLGP
jgi:hypothetical protein